ncbi:MAG: terminase family protein [Pirellulaceae bacterium]|nr:terminase family protein [Pirellulaceae bacterium]
MHILPPPLSSPYWPHSPHPQQREFLRLTCHEALFGGAAGGGKSIALLMAALQYVQVPGYAALLVRKDTQRMALAGGLLSRAHEWLTGTDATWNGQRREWRFPTGGNPATLAFGFLAGPLDKYRYASSEFQFIGFDELTELNEEDYLFLFSRLRGSMSLRIPLRVRAASNPGNVGHLWVKQRFVAGAEQPSREDRVFIPSRIADNPSLDGDSYRQSLLHLPAVERERLLHGDWSVGEEGLIRPAWLRYFVERPHDPAAALPMADRAGCQLELQTPDKELLTVVDPARCRRFVTIDPASTSAAKAARQPTRRASHTVAQVWEQPRRELARYLILRHQERVRVGFPSLARLVERLHATWQPAGIWIENERLGMAIVQQLGDKLPIQLVPTGGQDKETRAGPLLTKLERGEVFVPREASWLADFESELLAWTGDSREPCDQIDAAAYAVHLADRYAPTTRTIRFAT